MKYEYKDIMEKLEPDEYASLYRKYKFFELLQEAVYNGKTPDEFRKQHNLNTFNFPYWEIHHYESFLSDVSKQDHEESFSQDPSKHEHHVYFTFKKFIQDVEQERLVTDYLIDFVHDDENTGLDFYRTNRPNYSITRNYGKKLTPQARSIDIYILDDDTDDIETLKKISLSIYNYITEEGHYNESYYNKKRKLSDLPQMLFCAAQGPFRLETKDANSIVCIDGYTSIGKAAGENPVSLTLTGNFFANQSVFIYPFNAQEVQAIGKNVVMLRQAVVLSDFIGDNVFVGEKVRAESGSRLGNGCVINSGRPVMFGVEILPAQIVSAKNPWIYNIFKTGDNLTYADFIRKYEDRRKDYLENNITVLQ